MKLTRKKLTSGLLTSAALAGFFNLLPLLLTPSEAGQEIPLLDASGLSSVSRKTTTAQD